MEDNVEVVLFWDLNDSPPDMVALINVETDINPVLAQSHPRYRLSTTKYICGDINKYFAVEDQMILETLGFTLLRKIERELYCPTHQPHKSPSLASDVYLKTYLMRSALSREHPLPRNIMIISGDYDLYELMRIFSDGGYKVFFALYNLPNAPPNV